MTIILFLVDTSSSMNQRTYLGSRPTLLDVAKDAVEKFLKARARDAASRGDRYMLLTFEDPPYNIKAGWKESHSVFMNELKHLQASGITNLGLALKNAFDLLNLNRMQSGIDMYGHGRAPYYLEPSIIIVITDGSSLTHQMGVTQALELPMQNYVVPGSELTREPFRWDQRLFSLVLRLTGSPPMDNSSNMGLPLDSSPIQGMCAVTAGRSYSITSQRGIVQSIEALVSKIQCGVVIQFEKIGPDPPPIESHNSQPETHANATVIPQSDTSNQNQNQPTGTKDANEQQQQQIKIINGNSNQIQQSNDIQHSNSSDAPNIPDQVMSVNNHVANNKLNSQPTQPPCWHNTRSLIYIHRSVQKNFPTGHWPIPESFWPDQSLPALPPRTAHPIVKFTCAPTEPHMMDALPFDKYELESSPLTHYILTRKQPHVAWQVFVSNSSRAPGELGAAFGYLKASTNLNCVNLFVLPYNYPALLPIIEDMLRKPQHPTKPREWKLAFEEYLRNMPPYYANPLKRALSRMNGPSNLVPDNLDGNCFNYAIISKLKNLKQEAKVQFDRLIQSMQHLNKQNPNQDAVRVLQCGNNLRSQVESTSYTNMGCTGRPSQAFFFRYSAMKSELNEFPNFVIRVRDKASAVACNGYENLRIKHTFRNPYDIDRKDLIDQIHLMRANFMQPPSRIKFKDEDQIHTLPVSQMGNYQDYLKKQPTPLREIESTPVRQHMFGNPFKIDKKGMMVDEADSLSGGGPAGEGQSSPVAKGKKLNPNQRRRGPLPKDFILINQNSWQRSPETSPVSSPASSPARPASVDFESSAAGAPETSAGKGKLCEQNGNSIGSPNDTSQLPSPSSSSSSSPTPSSPTSALSPSSSLSSSCESLGSTASGNTVSAILNATTTSNNNSTHSSYGNNNNNNSNNSNNNANNTIRPTEQDLALRSDIFKHIRGPGMNNANVVKSIMKLQGDKRKFILEETIREAKRFKKVTLLHQLNLISRCESIRK